MSKSKMAAVFYFLLLSVCNAMELKQVVVLGRHNLRTPLTQSISTMSPKTWTKWEQKAGQLTKKGFLLEGFLGTYFAEWLNYHGLIEDCPKKGSVYIYANTRQRTRDTAKAFVDSAFRNCKIPVYSKNITGMDPVFNPILHNTTEAFKHQTREEIKWRLNQTNLQDVYRELDRITDIKNSEVCKKESFCNLTSAPDRIILEDGKEPNVTLRLFFGASIVDGFLMSHYEGHSPKDVAWGEIKTEKNWELLMKIVRALLDVRFSLPKAAKDYAKPLLQCIKDITSSNKTFSLLVGHDSNLTPVITALRFKKFSLPGQLEVTPIGAKLVFQRWTNGLTDFLKIEYVYQSWAQIRNAEKLSLEHPPQNITIYLNGYEADENGFYLWSDFDKILREVTE